MSKENSEALISGEVGNIDFAALCLALGFKIKDTSVIETVSLDSITAPRDKFNSCMWYFYKYGPNGDIDNVKNSWTIPDKFTTDTVKLARLLAHNLSALKHIIQEEGSGFYCKDLGGIGIITKREGYFVHNEPLGMYGGTCDTNTIALAITLGVTPMMCYRRHGRFYVIFDNLGNNTITLEDVKGFIASPIMRREDNNSFVAVLVCMLDNRQHILDNIHNMRKKLRITADNGLTQALVSKDGLSKEMEEAVYKHFD